MRMRSADPPHDQAQIRANIAWQEAVQGDEQRALCGVCIFRWRMLQWVWCSGISLAQCIAWPIDLSSTVGRGIVPSSPPCGLLVRHSTCCSAYAWPCCNLLTDSCPCECPMCAKARLARSTDAVCRARRKRRGWIRARIPMGRTTSSRSKHVGSCRSRMVSSVCKRTAESVSRVAQTGRSALRASAAQTAAQ